MARSKSFPDGIPDWLEKDEEWNAVAAHAEERLVRWRGRGVELVHDPARTACAEQYLISGGCRGESADVHAATDDWEHALEIIGMNEERPT